MFRAYGKHFDEPCKILYYTSDVQKCGKNKTNGAHLRPSSLLLYRYVNPKYVKCGCKNDSNKLLF